MAGATRGAVNVSLVDPLVESDRRLPLRRDPRASRNRLDLARGRLLVSDLQTVSALGSPDAAGRSNVEVSNEAFCEHRRSLRIIHTVFASIRPSLIISICFRLSLHSKCYSLTLTPDSRRCQPVTHQAGYSQRRAYHTNSDEDKGIAHR